MARFVVDHDTLLRIEAGEVAVASANSLVAPTLVRSQALAALYGAVQRGELSRAEGLERVHRFNALKVRFLGDRSMQATAWKVAEQLGWDDTYAAELVALTKLQGDFLVTADPELARAAAALVQVAPASALAKA